MLEHRRPVMAREEIPVGSRVELDGWDGIVSAWCPADKWVDVTWDEPETIWVISRTPSAAQLWSKLYRAETDAEHTEREARWAEYMEEDYDDMDDCE